MANSVIGEGKTTNEAIEDGLKKLKVSKDRVDIKVLDSDDKRSFFSILDPRKVKVELTIKENVKNDDKKPEKKEIKEKVYDTDEEDLKRAKEDIENFISSFIKAFDDKLTYEVKIEDYIIYININGESSGLLIGYRGDTLEALQKIVLAIADKEAKQKVRVILDIEGYRDKRAATLEDLAVKKAKIVKAKGKKITLEPMSSYERKVIHTKLQDFDGIQTYSIGENEYRRIVIDLA